jgi:hypothetical protein
MSKLYHPSPRVPAAEHRSILLAAVVDRVVLTGHREDMRGADPGHHLLDLVELRRGGQMGEIAGVNDKIRRVTEVVDLVDGPTERLGDVGIGGAGEPDVAVADLGEPQRRARDLGRGSPCDMGEHLAADDGEADSGTEPDTVADELAAAHLVGIPRGGHAVTTTVPCMNGWMLQV